ncbi:alkanesulfonate monooxygenase SsuD/methylene tetrahydromethanopterin reductase-like flavin-dependent oxidoreductase (luciferase family) [Novosphingobium sp. SG720]|nr:alkanesulfonate monooxygenase SsuD/methylene tetrahydromethanopterin reductase-like flavin-dependent oxidoreductase (luciferase family) [Novosphingobium sp. SG720]
MPVQFIGAIGTSGGSESRAPHGPVVDKVYLGAIARAHELAGFDRVLIGYFSSAPDGFQIAAYAAQQTERLQFLLAHRPGFVAPTLAARQLATLDQFIDGRLAVHIITGGSDAEQQRDGDFLGKAERYTRTDDYLDVVKRTWTATEAFDHDGPFYQVRQSFAAVKPVQQPHLPVYFGGSSDEAIAVAGKHADVFALWGETLEQTAQPSPASARQPRGTGGQTRSASACRCAPCSPARKTKPGRGPIASWPQPRRSAPRPKAHIRCNCSAMTMAQCPMSGPSACWTPPPAAVCATSGCGPKLPR